MNLSASTTREAQKIFFLYCYSLNLKRWHKARSAKKIFVHAFPMNLRRGHKARSAKKNFPETRGAGTAPRKEKIKNKKEKR